MSEYKQCRKCGEVKLLVDFPLCQGKPRARCKPCHVQDAREYAQKNRDVVLSKLRAWHRENSRPKFMGPFMPKELLNERRKQRRKLMTEEQRQRDIASKKKWAEKNKHIQMEIVRRRQARKKQATPRWADNKAMQEVYRMSVLLTKATGEPHDVDHIIPLTNDAVCGLHCEFNLRVVARKENRKKAAGFDESLLWY